MDALRRTAAVTHAQACCSPPPSLARPHLVSNPHPTPRFSFPTAQGGRERYVFFAFPHIAIDSNGEMGALSRPGRPKQSCACGALIAILGAFKKEGVDPSCKVPGVHDPLDPEFTILKQRLARRVRYEKLDPSKMDLPSLTHVAERTITDDLEYLIEKAVDPSLADYAVISGVQIHNWGKELSEDGDVSCEFVAPAKCYTVVNGLKTYIDLPQVPVSQALPGRTHHEQRPGGSSSGAGRGRAGDAHGCKSRRGTCSQRMHACMHVYSTGTTFICMCGSAC